MTSYAGLYSGYSQRKNLRCSCATCNGFDSDRIPKRTSKRTPTMRKRQVPRRVHINGDGTFLVWGDSFITTDMVLAKAVANELDKVDPQYMENPEWDDEDAGPVIARMPIGKSGWTVPWAMWRDPNRRWWLHPEYEISTYPGGTVEMLVERRKDGYHVSYVRGVERWAPTSNPGYIGEVDEWIPVVRHHRLPRS